MLIFSDIKQAVIFHQMIQLSNLYVFHQIVFKTSSHYVMLLSTLDKQCICVNTQLKSSKKAIKIKCVRTKMQF